jgi:acyl-CoA thioesterase-1
MRWLGLTLILALFAAAEAKAQVVALGSSGTRGYLLPLSDAWPSKLEVLLHQRGYNVSVANEGINGDNSEGMLSRLDSAAPNGTRVVIVSCCGNDNKNRANVVADHAGNVRTIISRLRARGIAVIFSTEGGGGPVDAAIASSAGAFLCGGMYQGVPPEDLESSKAGRHPTPQGHDIIAARMLPCVIRALGRKG